MCCQKKGKNKMILIINNSSDFSFALVDNDNGGNLISTESIPVFNPQNLEPDEFLAGDESEIVPLSLSDYSEGFVVLFPPGHDFSSGYDESDSFAIITTSNFLQSMQMEDTTGDGQFDTAIVTVDNALITAAVEGSPGGEEGGESISQEDYDALWATDPAGVAHLAYTAGTPEAIVAEAWFNEENFFNLLYSLMDFTGDLNENHENLLQIIGPMAASVASGGEGEGDSGPNINVLDLSGAQGEAVVFPASTFGSQPEHDVIIVADSSDDLGQVQLTLGDSWGDTWNGAELELFGFDGNDQLATEAFFSHNGPDDIDGTNNQLETIDVTVSLDTVVAVTHEGRPAKKIRLKLSTPGQYPSEISVSVQASPPPAPIWSGFESLTFVNAYDSGFYSGTDHNSMAFPGTQFITRPGQEITITGVDGVDALDADNNTPYTISSVKLKLLGHSSSFDDVFDLSLSSSQVWNGSPDWADAIFNHYTEPYRQVWVEYTATNPTTGYEHVHTQQVGFICMDGPSVNDIDLHMEYVSAKFSIYHFGIDLGYIGSVLSGQLGITDPETSESTDGSYAVQHHWGTVTYPDTFNPAQDRVIFLAKDIASSYSSVPVNPDLLTINIISSDTHSWSEKIESVTYLPLDSSAQDYSRFTNGYLLIKPQPGSFQEIAQFVYGPDTVGNAAQQITFQYNAGADSGAGRLISLNIDADYDSDGYHNNRDRFEQDGSIAEPFPSPILWGYLGNWDNSAGQYDYDMSFHYEGAPAAQYPGEVQYHNLYNRWLGGQEETESGNGFYLSRPWTSVGMEGQYVKYFFDRLDGIDFPETFDVSRLNVVLSGDSFELVPYADADNALFKVGTTSFPVSEGAYEGSNRHWVQFKARCLEVGSGSQVSLLHITYEMENGTILVDSQALYSLIPEGATNFNNPSQVISHENGDSSFSWILNAIDPSIIPAGVSTFVQPPVEDDPPADNLPEDNAPVALFNIDLLNPNSNQYGGVPTVLGNDISISSDPDSLLIAIDLQLSFSEVGKQQILDEVVAFYAATDELPKATSGEPELQGIIRPIIDAFISEGYNLDLWFGLGEQDLSVYASDAGGNFPQDHHDALVRYGQSDGFNASPPPQSIWPSGAEYVDIGGLLQNYVDFLLVGPTLEDGSPDFAQLDFSGKIVLPTLTYEIDPEPNTTDTGTGKTRLVAVRSQNGVYALDYNADTYTDGSPFVNPQYAAVDVQSVNLQSLNNNEDNDPQQGENNMSYNINHFLDVDSSPGNEIHTFTLSGLDSALQDADRVLVDWEANGSPDPKVMTGIAEQIAAAATNGDSVVSWSVQFFQPADIGDPTEMSIWLPGSSVTSVPDHENIPAPEYTDPGGAPQAAGMIIDIMDDNLTPPNDVLHTQTFSDPSGGDQSSGGQSSGDQSGGDQSGGSAVQNTLSIGNLEDGCNFPRGPMARQLRFHKLIDESAVDFTISAEGLRVAGDKDFAGALADQLVDEVAGTQSGTPVVSIQSELQVQSDRMLELERMLHGGDDLSDSGSSIVFDSRASMKLMAEELKGDQDAIQVALRLKDGATAFEDLDKYKINSLDMQDLDPTASGNDIVDSGDGTDGSPFVFVSDFTSSEFASLADAIEAMRAKLERYDGDSDPLSNSNFGGLSDNQAKLDALIAVYNTLEQGVTVKLDEFGSSLDISGTHFDASMDLEEALRKLDAGIIDADLAIAANDDDITDIRSLLGDSVIDDYVAFDKLNKHRVENETITGSDLPTIPALVEGAWPAETDVPALFLALTGYDPARHDDNESTTPVDDSGFNTMSDADQKAHLDACRAAGVSGAVRRNAAGESDFFITMTDSAFDSSETVESALRKLDIDHAATEHEVGEAAGLLGITLGSRDETGAYTDGTGLVLTAPSGGGFLSGADTVVAIANALDQEAQEASDERDNVAGQIGSALSDADLSGKLPNSYTTIVAAINGEYTWRTEGINYKPSVADVAALDAAIINDATREKGDTYWVEGVKTRYTIAGFANADGMLTTDSEYDREIAIAEGTDQAAVPASDTAWDADYEGSTLQVLYPDEFADHIGGGGDASDIVSAGVLVAASAADTVFVSITQSMEMAKSDQQDMLDQLALEHYDMGVGGMSVLIHDVDAVVASGALGDLLRSTNAYAGSGLGLGDVGYGEVLLNGLTVGWLMKIEGYTAVEVVDAANPLNEFVPCATIPVVFPHDQIVVKYSKSMDRAKEAQLIAG